MHRWFLYVTVFFTGLCVTAIEMTASRFLAPFFGTSIFVWANVIGVVLIALSLGYFIGGKLADRFPQPKKLFGIILVTGILTDLIPILGKPYLAFSSKLFAGGVPSLVIGSFLATLIIFAIPLFLLGMMSPWIIRISTREISEVGEIAGKVYGISTVGSIIGVFLPVFLTIPFLGSQKTFFIFGSILILIAIIGLGNIKKLWIFFILSLALLVLPFQTLKQDIFTIAQAESLYNYIRVNEYPDKSRRLIINEGRGVQSIYHPKKYFTGYYWDYAGLLPVLNPAGKNMLILGLAGGTSSRLVSKYFPNIHIDAVEIDPKLISLGKKYFELEQPNMEIFNDDGRMFLKTSTKKYDFIMVDVYTNELSIPFHMATVEFFEEVQNHLNDNGIVMMNVAIMANKRPKSVQREGECIQQFDLVQNLQNTFSKVFPENRIFKPEGSGNYLFFGTPKADRSLFSTLPTKPPDDLPRELQTLFRIFKNFSKQANHMADHTFFTDDKSSIDWNLP